MKLEVGQLAPVRGLDRCPPAIAILRCGALAYQICRRGAELTVASVLERCIYLRSGEAFICIGEPAIGNGPLTLVADIRACGQLSTLGLHVDQPACCGDRCIAVGETVWFMIDCGAVWHQPAWPAARPPDELADACARIAQRAASEGPWEGFARAAFGSASAIARLAAGARIARFKSWLSEVATAHPATVTALPEAVRGLVGLGPGLTPSGDDFLVGAIALLDALAQDAPRRALAQAVDLVPSDLTSALSLCLLRTAAAGQIGEMAHHLVSSVILGNVDAAIATAGAIGHSSGWDMLTGISTALSVVVALSVAERRRTPRHSS